MSRKVVKPTFNASKIQNIINSNDIISFESGIYTITQTLAIPSNKTIYLNDAILRRHCSAPVIMTKSDKNTKGYNGACNIKIVGGTIEGMNSLGLEPTNMMLLFHSYNVSIINTKFLDTTGSHAIDIGGCKDTNITGCKFMGYKSYDRNFREAIQIDFAYHGGIPYFPKGSDCFDDTHCDGVNIIGCEFGESTRPPQYVAIGTHSQTASNNYHKNINIKYNIATGNGCSNYMGFFARIVNMRYVNIVGNVVKNYGRFVYIDTSPNYYNTEGGTVSGVKNKGSEYILISDNTILSSDDTFAASSVFIKGNATNKIYDVTIKDNVFDKNSSISRSGVVNYVATNNVVK